MYSQTTRHRSLRWAGAAGLLTSVALIAACAPGGGPNDTSTKPVRPSIPVANESSPTTTAPRGATTTVPAPATPPPSIPTTTLPTPTGSTPDVAGVTYRDIDGGQAYYGRWANSFPTDPSFFPIGVWAESFSNDQVTERRIDDYARIGINVFAEPYGMPDATANYIQSKSMFTIGDGLHEAAQLTTDEPDLRGCNDEIGVVTLDQWPAGIGQCMGLWGPNNGPVSPASLQAWSDLLRRNDSSRPVYNQFTKAPRAGLGVYKPDMGRTECEDYNVDANTAREYFASSDIISYDWYVQVDEWTPVACRNIAMQGDAVRNTRLLSDYAKPVWPFIGLTNLSNDNRYKPTPANLNAEVWTSIVAGARGIQYFQHNFSTVGETSRVLLDARYTPIRDQITATNARIKSLAPVINAPYADGLTTASGAVDTMSKAYGGQFYVFVTSRQSASQTATFNVAGLGNGTVEVVDEGRSIPASGGQFTDTFADQNAVHIYRFTPAA